MTRSIAIFGLALVLWTRPASAQTFTLTPINPAAWDASVTLGWLGGDKTPLAEPWNNWYDTFATSIDVGRYWATHLKTEVGTTLTSKGDVYSQQQIAVPGRPGPVFFSREHEFSVRALNLSASYQAFENAWVHPFLAAGVHLAWERERVENQLFIRELEGLVPPGDTSRTDVDARPFVSGGAKFYVSERGFIRTDLSTAFDTDGASRVWWRIGGGIDF